MGREVRIALHVVPEPVLFVEVVVGLALPVAQVVLGEVAEPQLVQAPLQPPADLTAHLPEAGPAHAQARQDPLEEADAVAIAHGAEVAAAVSAPP